MTIYDRTPYTYLVGWSKHNKWYYGRRTAKGCCPDELWVSYFTSSKRVAGFRKNFGEPDVIQIRKTFLTIEECVHWETTVLKRMHVVSNQKWLNQSVNTGKFDNTGKTWVVEISTGITTLITQMEFEMNREKYIHTNHGKVRVRDKEGNQLMVAKDDPRYLSGELFPTFKGKTTVKDKDGNILSIDVDDPRYTSGEFTHINSGKIQARDTTGKIISINKDDPRYLSGELVGATKGMIVVRDKSGNVFSVAKDDPRYLSGELVGATKGFMRMKDRQGNFYFLSKTDPRYISGELIHWNKSFTQQTH